MVPQSVTGLLVPQDSLEKTFSLFLSLPQLLVLSSEKEVLTLIAVLASSPSTGVKLVQVRDSALCGLLIILAVQSLALPISTTSIPLGLTLLLSLVLTPITST